MVERRAVKIGDQGRTTRVVLEGLTGDEWVIINGLLRAIPGRPVTPDQGSSRSLQAARPRRPTKPREEPPHDLQIFHRAAHLRQRHCHRHSSFWAWSACYRLPVSQYPNIVPPTIQVTTRYPGASAEIIAATVGIPIEQAVNGVKDSIYMSSTSASDGSYTLTITFNVGTDLDTSLALVQNHVNSAMAQLPEPFSPRGSPSRKSPPIILLVVSLYSGRRPLRRNLPVQLRHHQSAISPGPPARRRPGPVVGAGPYSMRVWLDPNKLHDYGLTTMDVVTAIQRPKCPGGGRPAGRAAGAAEPGLPVHHQRPGPAR